MEIILSTDEIMLAVMEYVQKHWPDHQRVRPPPGELGLRLVIDASDSGNEVIVRVKLESKTPGTPDPSKAPSG